MKLLSNTKQKLAVLAVAIGSFASLASSVQADEPGRGKTAAFEVDYLKMMIDHHFSALRMTELAAGTEHHAPTAAISVDDRTHPTPGFGHSEPHANLDEIKSLARVNNRMQREEILDAQKFLRDWYGIDHQPQLSMQAKQDISKLDAKMGREFDLEFIKIMSRHHYAAAASSLDCLVARSLKHGELRQYCQNILDAQVSDIDKMRTWGCENFKMCDFQPQEHAMMHHP